MRDRETYRVQGGQFASSDKYLMCGDKPIAMFVRQAWYGDSELPDRIAKALNSQPTASEQALVLRMVKAYQRDPVAVAKACDEVIDRSGALLGYLRDAALYEGAK